MACLSVKTCLVSQGVPESKIDIVAVGENQNLSRADVLNLHEANPNKPSFAKRNSQALAWAYNRRVDITLLPNGQKSTQFFPGDADEAKCFSGVSGKVARQWRKLERVRQPNLVLARQAVHNNRVTK